MHCPRNRCALPKVMEEFPLASTVIINTCRGIKCSRQCAVVQNGEGVGGKIYYIPCTRNGCAMPKGIRKGGTKFIEGISVVVHSDNELLSRDEVFAAVRVIQHCEGVWETILFHAQGTCVH